MGIPKGDMREAQLRLMGDSPVALAIDVIDSEAQTKLGSRLGRGLSREKSIQLVETADHPVSS